MVFMKFFLLVFLCKYNGAIMVNDITIEGEFPLVVSGSVLVVDATSFL